MAFKGPAVVVAGSGVLGSVCALSLARAGAAVTLADPTDATANASAVAAGMLAPALETLFDDRSPPFDLMVEAREMWRALSASAGVGLEQEGSLALGSAEEVETWFASLRSIGAHAEMRSPAQVAERAPWLSAPRQAVFTAEDWRLSAPRALAAVRRAAEAAGVTFVRDAVRDWTGRAAILSSGARLTADALVIATGAAGDLTRLAPELAALASIKGHILRTRRTSLSGPVVRLAGLYIRPDPAGALVGATMEPGVADPAVDPRIVAALADRLADIAPSLTEGPPRGRAGIRAATADGLPLAGPSTTEGVWLAAGARRNGWLLAPLIARIVTAGVTGAAPPAWAKSMDPARFSR